MTNLNKTLMFAAALSMSASFAMAQDTTAPTTDAPATPTAPAADAPAASAPDAAAPAAQAPAKDGPGTTYIASTHGDWKVQCVHTEDGSDPCQLYQLLKDQSGNNVADISMFPLPENNRAAVGATIMVPLETLLTQNMVMKLDSNEPKVYPFTFCAQAGCFARIGLTADELTQYKKGSKIEMTIVPVAAPNQKVNVAISLAGFTAAYDEVKASNTKAQAKDKPAAAQ
ncbi:invasion associated locus B family protein [Thioclava sp. 'Guangxiensis']|uniref:invasion associated locus B family protein n=1 Tax=Thioclava sp. 'Guangxiensis' TaxID=3149044 RepID=UPI003877B1B3